MAFLDFSQDELGDPLSEEEKVQQALGESVIIFKAFIDSSKILDYLYKCVVTSFHIIEKCILVCFTNP